MSRLIRFFDFKVSDSILLSDYLNQSKGIILFFSPDLFSLSSKAILNELQEIYSDIRSEGWNIIGVSTSSLSIINTAINDYQLDFPIVFDLEGNISKRYLSLGTGLGNLPPMSTRKLYIIANDKKIIKVYESTFDALNDKESLYNYVSILKENLINVTLDQIEDETKIS
ncbi:MAG: peroxiredoxin family protein [Candidatus Heimdallarchaeota archaeon]|nr:peroxiredoxin family protein [Candidatus Heimdallarchaeota archaeon]MDH5645721.1 peroxiredoxin family protein [Candidatus Heimdallarchaeota archaeon]